MNEELKSIFNTSIEVDGEAVPTAHLRYRGKSDKYIIWTVTDSELAICADDEPQYAVDTIDVDVFSKGSYLKIVSKIKKLMLENGYIWASDSPEMYEENTGYYHITIQFEKERYLQCQELV